LTVRAKAAMAQGQAERAARLTATRAETSGLSSGMRAEYAATHGLALACVGRRDGAATALAEAEEWSSIPEVLALASCARAVLALQRRSTDEAARELDRLFTLVIFDPLVIGARAYAGIADAVHATGLHVPQRLLDAMKTPENRSLQEELLASLTPREREVLELLTRGYTNREIASTLVIAEVTAKVHVRRIIKKLGVRSRTEAAIAAIQRRDA
jgi:RNA polymerase sigma factor (sigma-70 family)